MTQNQSDGIRVIATERQLTGGTQGKLRTRIEEAVEDGGLRILLDLSGTERVDSSGLGEIVRLHNMVRGNDGRLALFGLQESAQLLMKLTKLDEILEVYESQDEAVSAMEGGRAEA